MGAYTDDLQDNRRKEVVIHVPLHFHSNKETII